MNRPHGSSFSSLTSIGIAVCTHIISFLLMERISLREINVIYTESVEKIFLALVIRGNVKTLAVLDHSETKNYDSAK